MVERFRRQTAFHHFLDHEADGGGQIGEVADLTVVMDKSMCVWSGRPRR